MKKKKCRLLICLMLVMVVSVLVTGYQGLNCYNEGKIQEGIAHQIIRFHVRANSDSEQDQNLKLCVKDKIVTYMQPLLAESSSVDESRNILSGHIDQIKQLALETIHSQGYDYAVNVYFEESYFPMKTYADVTFPPGVYEAFRVDIGDYQGKNWWCVLYPPLCFIDSVYGELPQDSKDTLKNILTDDEYNAITKTQYKFRFKYLTFLNDILDEFSEK